MFDRLTRALQYLRVGHLWLRRPTGLTGQRVCLLACFRSGGAIAENTLHLANAWRLQGFKVILVVASDGIGHLALEPQALSGIDGVMLRPNIGYDFGSWAHALRSMDELRHASLLAMANDSVFGPLDGFADMLARVDASAGDVVGLTDSHEVRHHIQSYLIFYKPKALLSPAFDRFWSSRTGNDRDEVIFGSEVPLKSELERGNLRIDVLFPTVSAPALNPTLLNWRGLLDAGFPFVKVQLMRDRAGYVDVSGWDRILQDRAFDPQRVRRHLGTLYAGSAAEAGASPAFQVAGRAGRVAGTG